LTKLSFDAIIASHFISLNCCIKADNKRIVKLKLKISNAVC